MKDATDYDIVIAGGGMVGTSLALALRPLRLRVAVVEAVARQAAAQPSFDDRSTALSRSTQRSFEAMGLWDQIVSASTPVKRIHVSDKGRFGFSHIDAKEQGVDALGHVVINRVLGQVLQRSLTDAPDVDEFCPQTIVDVNPAPGDVAVSLGNGEKLNGRLLVVCDGAKSSLRDALGIGVQIHRYEQSAVIGNVLSEKRMRDCAFERFTKQGPLALLPIADGRAAFVWTVNERGAERVLALDDAAFIAELQEQFGNRLGAFSRVGRRAAYPLMLSRADRVTATRSVLIGNAAHGLHPVSAQGFNLGMRDVAALCDCIADADGADPGAAELLARYSSWRSTDQRKLVHFTDNLVRMFGSDRPATRILRDVGMIGFDLIPGVRSLFARHTMGLAGDLPRLSRGVPLR